jgi:hypothetical protein
MAGYGAAPKVDASVCYDIGKDAAVGQGLTLVHFAAQHKHIMRDTLGPCFSPSPLDRGIRGGVSKAA